MLSNEYVAGLFDGEGCVHAAHNRPGWGASVSIGICNEEVVDALYNQYGGSKRMQLTKTGKKFFMWRIGVLRGLDFLRSIEPYCIVKKSVIRVGIKLGEIMCARSSSVDKSSLTDEELLLRQILVFKLHCLNKGKEFTLDDLTPFIERNGIKGDSAIHNLSPRSSQ